MTAGYALLFITFAGVLGVHLGMWIADREWRSKAEGFTRMSSGGRLYRVTYEE